MIASILSGRPADDFTRALEDANAWLDAGDASRARQAAHQLLEAAGQRGDTASQARALSFLAHCDRLVSRFRRSHEASQRAAFLFKERGDEAGEALALSTASYTASCLGRNEDAVESGLLCERLSDHARAEALRAVACNTLGIAYFWSHCFDKATDAFERSIQASLQGGSNAFQPRLNLACAESYRLVHERTMTGRLPDPSALCALVETATSAAGRHEPAALQLGMRITLQAMASTWHALALCWSGDPRQASRVLTEATGWADQYGTTNWLHALERWVAAEIAWSDGRAAEALPLLSAAVDIASDVEHEQLACTCLAIKAQFHEMRGEHALAVGELHALRRRQLKIRQEMIASRERLVEWQVESRERDRSLMVLEDRSRVLERMSLEDPLTGIPNRRSLERRLAEGLAECRDASRPLAVALVDVDDFKQVNDTHGHGIGDEVLRAIAATLVVQVREQDFVARLAGDEFVLVFPRTTREDAERICQRVRAGLAAHPWADLATDLGVTASVGVAEAGPEDSLESLLARADAGMYREKRERA